MGRFGVSYEAIELIAEKILQSGSTPTIEKVRLELGTGSNTTISKHLSRWREKRFKANPNILPPLQTPPDPVNQAVIQVWQQMQNENEEKIKEIETAAQQRIEKAYQIKENATEECNRFATDNQHLRKLLQESKAHNVMFEKQQIDAQQAYAALEAMHTAHTETHAEFKAWAEQSLATYSNNTANLNDIFKNQIATLKELHQQEITRLTEHAEQQQHEQLILIDELKTNNVELQQQLTQHEQLLMSISNNISQLMRNINEQSQEIDSLLLKQTDNHQHIVNHLNTQTETQLQELDSHINQQTHNITLALESQLSALLKTISKRSTSSRKRKTTHMDS